ncbi:MAG TPA: hypothetical protein VFG90_08265 [Nitrososphaeraceae archaeon]|nr:hypothetical protein [Nitrososphaeraceae archaeon]
MVVGIIMIIVGKSTNFDANVNKALYIVGLILFIIGIIFLALNLVGITI